MKPHKICPQKVVKTLSLFLFGKGIILMKNVIWLPFRGNNCNIREISIRKHYETYKATYNRSEKYKKWHQYLFKTPILLVLWKGVLFIEKSKMAAIQGP